MSDFLFSVNVVAPLFMLMGVGYIMRKTGIFSEEFLSQLNRFVFRFLLPVMLFHDIQSSYTGDFSNTRLILASVIGTLVVIGVSFCIVPLFVRRKAQRGSMIQGIYRSNFLIYGLPLATGIYGKEAIATITMLMGIMIPLYNVSAVIILTIFSESGSKQLTLKGILTEIARNPLIIGCVTGLLAGYFQIQLPKFINTPLSQLAAAAAPLTLFVMGGEFKFRYVGKNITKALFVTASRLIIVPLTAMFVFVSMGFRNVELTVLLCIFATPTAIASYIMSKNLGTDYTLSSQIVVLTTACSSATILGFVFGLRSLGYL